MERIYRGYPQALHAMERSGDLMPYMLYRREEQAGRRSAALEKRRFRDPEYFKGLYPRSVRRCQSFVEACCDRYDHPGSPIYDEYPDRVLLLGIRNRILEKMREQGEDPDQDLVLASDPPRRSYGGGRSVKGSAYRIRRPEEKADRKRTE